MPGAAQAQLGELQGTVVAQDTTSTVVTARITASSLSEPALLLTSTDAKGHYAFPKLRPGKYTIRVECEPFRTWVRSGIRVRANASTTLPVELAPRSPWAPSAHVEQLSRAEATPDGFARVRPEEEGLRSDELMQLTRWLRDHPEPIFSLLIARHGRLLYELYGPGVDRDDAHYLMSVTKSVLSAAIGVAVDRKWIGSPDQSMTQLLPRRLFPTPGDLTRFEGVTLKRVMGMAALDAPDPPRDRSPEALARGRQYLAAVNRASFALSQPVLKTGFQYNDGTPALASGVLTAATHQSAFDFAEQALFLPMGFANEEWLHQDASGMDNGGYGLRLRPIDMLKFGQLYLNGGIWDGQTLLSKAWVETSFTPWNTSDPKLERPNYGWYWWTYDFGPGWTARVANGWKGQRIAVIPEQALVLVLTADIEDGSEDEFFKALIIKSVKPAVERGATPDGGTAAEANAKALTDLLNEVNHAPSRLGEFVEYRMVPSQQRKQERKPLKWEY